MSKPEQQSEFSEDQEEDKNEPDGELVENKEDSHGLLKTLFYWQLSEKELKTELKIYNNTLPDSQPIRKAMAMVMLVLAGLSILFLVLGWFDNLISMGSILFLLLLIPFVYKGQKWAIIVTMLHWTFNQGYKAGVLLLENNLRGSDSILQIVFWALIMNIYWRAYRVEEERDKRK